MTNKEKYQEVFINSLSLEKQKFNSNLKYNEIPEWDSIGHMSLISGLEDAFKITIETEDIIDFSSYLKGQEILILAMTNKEASSAGVAPIAAGAIYGSTEYS